MPFLLFPLAFFIVFLLALAALAAVASLSVNAFPWLLIFAGVWMVSRSRYGPRGGRRHSPWACGPGAAVGTTAGVRTEQQQPPSEDVAQTAGLPINLRVKAEQIQHKVQVLLAYADRFPPFSRDLYIVRQTATEYLPRTLAAFQALPQEAVDRVLSGHSRTAREELSDQLDLLDRKLDDIAQDLERQDAQTLLANRLFLEDRFGPGRT